MALTADSDAFVVDDFGQRKNASNPGKGLLCLRIISREQLRKTSIKAGLQTIGAIAIHLAKGLDCLIVLLALVFFPAQCHPGGAKSWAELDRLLQMAQTLGLIRFRDAANVLLIRVKAQPASSSDERLFGDIERWIELAGKLPGQRVEDGDHVLHLATSRHSCGHVQMRHVQQLYLGNDLIS